MSIRVNAISTACMSMRLQIRCIITELCSRCFAFVWFQRHFVVITREIPLNNSNISLPTHSCPAVAPLQERNRAPGAYVLTLLCPTLCEWNTAALIAVRRQQLPLHHQLLLTGGGFNRCSIPSLLLCPRWRATHALPCATHDSVSQQNANSHDACFCFIASFGDGRVSRISTPGRDP